MPSSVSDNNPHSQHRLLLSESAGSYALNLSHLVTSDAIGDIKLSLSPPSDQTMIFQTAEKYDVSLNHDSAIGVYFISGDAAEVAQFLKLVRLLPEGNAAQDAIIIKSIITEKATGKDTSLKLLIAPDSESGVVKTSLTYDAAGNGVSQVAQQGTVFEGEFEEKPSPEIMLLFQDIPKVQLKESPLAVAEEKEFGDVNAVPVITSQAIDIAADGVAYNYLLTAKDELDEPLNFNILTLPTWLTFFDNGDGTATLSGTPGAGDIGDGNIVEATVSDGVHLITQTFDIFVADASYAGTIGNDGIVGDGGDNVIGGGFGDDTLDGGDGSDFLQGGLGGDVLNGDSGNDTIDGGAGNDTIDGGSGDDLVDGGDGRDNILGGAGNDTVNGGASHDFIDGGDGNDSLVGGGNDDHIIGGAGDDTIDGGNQHDSLEGGDGNDSITGDSQSDILNGNAGRDTLIGGNTGRDVFVFDNLAHSTISSSDVIADYVIDEDIIYLDGLGIIGFGVGVNELTLSTNGVQTFLDHNSSNFRITLDGVFSSSDIDIVTNVGNPLFWGNTSANNHTGTVIDEYVFGNHARDTLRGEGGNDVLVGGQNDDSLEGGDGNDTLDGGLAHDVLLGDDGDDFLYAGGSEDSLNGGDGADILEGGAEADIFAFSDLSHSTISESDVIADYDNDQGDIIYLDGLGITGIGLGVNELTISDDGAQTFLDHNSSSFRVTLNGVYDASELSILNDNVIFGSTGADTYIGGANDDFITGNNARDSIDGGLGNDSLHGGTSLDTINGGAGDDSITGGGSNDVLNGGDGDDLIYGGNQEDTINGGAGLDTLSGGSDGDVFVFSESAAGNEDVIMTFGESIDTIALSDAVFVFASGDGTKDGVTLTDDVDVFDVGTDFSGGNFTSGGNITFLFDNTDDELWYDADGSTGGGVAVLIFTIDSGYSFDITHFEGWA